MAVTSVAMETTVEFSHVSSTNMDDFAPFNDKVVMFNCFINKEIPFFKIFLANKNYLRIK